MLFNIDTLGTGLRNPKSLILKHFELWLQFNEELQPVSLVFYEILLWTSSCLCFPRSLLKDEPELSSASPASHNRAVSYRVLSTALVSVKVSGFKCELALNHSSSLSALCRPLSSRVSERVNKVQHKHTAAFTLRVWVLQHESRKDLFMRSVYLIDHLIHLHDPRV